jgi:hypothetical protein
LFAEAEAQAAPYKGCKRRAGASTEALHPTLHPTNETSGEKTSNISLLLAFSIYSIFFKIHCGGFYLQFIVQNISFLSFLFLCLVFLKLVRIRNTRFIL